MIDGLAFGVLPDAAETLRDSHSLVALVHHPLALESGLSAREAAALRASERAALACARHVIATSAATARLLASDYGVPSERLSVVEPGTDPVAARPRKSEHKSDGTAALASEASGQRGHSIVRALARRKRA